MAASGLLLALEQDETLIERAYWDSDLRDLREDPDYASLFHGIELIVVEQP